MQPEHGPPAVGDSTTLGPPPRAPAPLAWPVAAFAVGIAAAEAAAGRVPAVVALLATPLALLAAISGPRRTTAGFLMLAAFFVGAARHDAAVRLGPLHVGHRLDDRPFLARLTGRIVSTPVTRPAERINPFIEVPPQARTQFLLEAIRVERDGGGVPVSGLVRVNVEADGIPAELGEAVTVRGWLYRPAAPRNPGDVDWAAAQRLEGVYACMSAPGAEHVLRIEGSDRSAWLRLIDRMRAGARSFLFEPYAGADRSQGLLDAIVLGQRSKVTRELNEAFIRTGAMHFLAVSGFHVGVLAGCAWMFMRWLLRRGVIAAGILTIAVIASYAMIAEHNAPVLRASVMAVLACLGRMRGRPLNVFNWLALSAALLLAYNPLELFRPGFQLSFLLILALVTLWPPLYAGLLTLSEHAVRRLSRLPEAEALPEATSLWSLLIRRCGAGALGVLSVNLVAWVAAFPLATFHFQRFAPYGALQSLLLTPFVVAVVLLGYLTIVAGALLDALGSLFGGGLQAATAGLLWLVEHLSRLPGAVVDVQRPPLWIVFGSYVSLAALYLLLRQRTEPAEGDGSAPHAATRSYAAAGGVLVLLATGWSTWFLTPHHRPATPKLHVLAVGNGSAAILCGPGGDATLFDLGTLSNWDVGSAASRALRALGQGRVEAIYVSHANFDHYSGVPTLVEAIRCERLLVNPYFEREQINSRPTRLFFDLLGPRGPPLQIVREGDRRMVPLGARESDSATIDLLWPPPGLDASWKPNDRSLVQRLTIGRTRVLITGDVERDAMQELLKAHRAGRIDLRCDVLIAPHHGSIDGRATSDFYAAVAPAVVIVSTGRERERLLDLIRDVVGPRCRVISTRDAGAALLQFHDDGSCTVSTPYAAKQSGDLEELE